MTNVVFRGRALPLAVGETVLECLERHGVRAPSSCRAGHCRTCTMVAVDSVVPAHAQPDFTPEEIRQGLFLPCVCRPTEDLVVRAADEGPGMPAAVIARHVHNDQIVRLELLPSLPFPFKPGQFIHVVGPAGVVRPYSLASEPDGALELHVRRYEGGALSPWLVDELAVGEHVHIRGPFGNLHYRPHDTARPLVLAGFSTGVAPLLGVLRDALSRGHTGPIDVFYGAHTVEGLYLLETLQALAARNPGVAMHFSLLQGKIDGVSSMPLADLMGARLGDFDRAAIYLAGSPLGVFELEEWLRRRAGGPLDITSDPFYFGRG